MKRALLIYALGSVIFTLFFGFDLMDGDTDVEYKYKTEIRMHAYDILKNNQSTFTKFNPDECTVERNRFLSGQFVNVTCATKNNRDEVKKFNYKYSKISLLLDFIFESTYGIVKWWELE